KHLHIPVIIHESDMTPGLANKLAIPSASKVCCNFPETVKLLPEGKAVLSGSPIREELFQGDKNEGLNFCKFTPDKPVLLVIGGSLGSVAINNAIRNNIDDLLEKFQVIHLCGKNNLDTSLEGHKGYVQFEYIKKELKNLFACADIVVSRAGANAICELLALRKPNILIPLGLEASRGDQILNAESFEKQGYSYVLQENDVTSKTLLHGVNEVYQKKDCYIEAMNQSELADPIETIVNLANQLIKKK
ncbi:MAG: glycosyltransferase, partial [Anaerostipes sp.]|nr:glycosyltransferase [Anaerostipes sp.]